MRLFSLAMAKSCCTTQLKNGSMAVATFSLIAEAVRNELKNSGNTACTSLSYSEMTHKTKGRKKGKVGSSFDGFLAEQGILEECEEQAVKQILADQIKAAMEKERLTKAAMAIRMQTSRRALDRLLDPANTSVTLHTLQRAAVAIGCQLRLELI
ncbi:Fis family transcriptional regulator (modular protein) [Candidatus Sulfopaludibacter sp. SbA4]|nr:Fis family transcriptional regulator (modular protein) [Candidatus Sulfopaludibacter sp. SbA4]